MPDLFVYLRTDPDMLLHRIKSRARPEEQNITIEYLTSLHQLHENWVCGSPHFNSTCHYFSGVSGFHFDKKSKFMLLLALSIADWNNEENVSSADF